MCCKFACEGARALSASRVQPQQAGSERVEQSGKWKTVYDLLGAIRYQLSIFKFMNISNSDANQTL